MIDELFSVQEVAIKGLGRIYKIAPIWHRCGLKYVQKCKKEIYFKYIKKRNKCITRPSKN